LKIPPAVTRTAGAKVSSTEKIKPSEKLSVANRSASRGHIFRTISSVTKSNRKAYIGEDSLNDYANQSE
jgi:hypothetical protein